MTIEESVKAVLAGNAGVTAICPASRIKPDGVYQGIARPYMKHFAAGLAPLQTHSGMASLKVWNYQISMFAESIASLASLRTAVMAALEASVDPKFFITGMIPLGGVDSTDTPVIGQALLLEAWYE